MGATHSVSLVVQLIISQEWDKARSFQSGNLDSILESLEKRKIPPDFHLSSSSSSLFGSQHSDGGGTINGFEASSPPKHQDRSNWKSLRDFVDFGAIVKATEEMDEDRDILDVRILPSTGLPSSLA